MENEPKKISFGFKNLLKKPSVIVKQPVLEEKKTEIIEYIEEKSIKVVGVDDTPKGPLVIPMKESNKTKLTNLIDIVQNNFQEPEIPLPPKTENGNTESVNSENLSLEEQAARELLNDTKNVKVEEDAKRVIDVSKNVEKVTFEGEKESSLDDYEDIPVQEFGKAMLRGMGWKDGHGIGKNEQLVKMTQPLQRPKGMGLGADKMTKQDTNDKPAVDKDGNALKCVKGAYVKIIAGYHKGNYGQIIGLDDESGRFIIKTALNNLNVSLNEFLVSPVTKEEYTKNSKVINNAKYEEYIQKKENEEKKKLEKIKNERNSTDEEDRKRADNKREKIKEERKSYSSEDEHRSRKDKYEEKKRNIKKERKYSDSEDDYKYNDKYSKDIKKERLDKYEKRTVKKEESDYEEKKSRKQSTSKYDSDEETRDRKQRDKYKNKSKVSSDSEVDERKSRKYEKSSSKYNSDEETRDRKHRDKYKSKSKYSSDTEEEEKKKSKKKSAKYDSDSDDYEQKKKHKKKKSKKYSSDEDSDDKYKKKSKKKEKKYESDSEDEKHKKKKKDKYKDKRDRSKHDRK